MQTIDFSEVKNKVKDNLDGKKFDLLPYGIEKNGKLYIYGKTVKNACFIVNEEGQFVPKEEAIPVFKQFVKIWTILMEQSNYFKQYIKNNPVSIFEKLQTHLHDISANYDVNDLEEDIKTTKQLLSIVIKEQKTLKTNFERLRKFYNEKCKDGMFLTMGEVEDLLDLKDTMTWNVYNQDRSMYDAIAPMKKIHRRISQKVSFFNLKVMSLKKLLNVFIAKKMVQRYKSSVQLFEKDSKGNTLTFQQFVKNHNKNFEADFNKEAKPLLMN